MRLLLIGLLLSFASFANESFVDPEATIDDEFFSTGFIYEDEVSDLLPENAWVFLGCELTIHSCQDTASENGFIRIKFDYKGLECTGMLGCYGKKYF